MSSSPYPEPGTWFQIPDDQLIMVIACDEQESLVEFQYFDGAIEEVDFFTWTHMGLEPADGPDDWSGPYDEIEYDDLGYDDVMTSSPTWKSLSELIE